MTEERRLFEMGDIVVFSDEAFPPGPRRSEAQQIAIRTLYYGVRLRVVNVQKSTDPFYLRHQLLRVDPIDAKLARADFWVDCRRYGRWWDGTWFRLA